MHLPVANVHITNDITLARSTWSGQHIYKFAILSSEVFNLNIHQLDLYSTSLDLTRINQDVVPRPHSRPFHAQRRFRPEGLLNVVSHPEDCHGGRQGHCQDRGPQGRGQVGRWD